MCIRDRADLKAIADKNVVNKSCIGMGYYDTLTPKVILRNVCLLYTSDAADERSSVDLGGRRIIKKKNWITKEW